MPKEIILQPINRWFIFDCNGTIIGRECGYLSHARAYNAASKLKKEIMRRFEARLDNQATRVWSINTMLVQTQNNGPFAWYSYKEAQ